MRVLLLLACLASLGAAPAIRPRFPLSKETTYALGPLDAWGYVDYTSAINERRTKGLKPADNAAVLLWRAVGPRPEGALVAEQHFSVIGMERPPEKGDYFVSIDRYARERLKLEADKLNGFFDEQSRASRRAWKAKDLPRIAAWLKANEKPLAVAIEASKRDRYFTAVVCGEQDGKRGLLIGALLPSVQQVRGIAAALSARAMLRAGEGDADGAWADLRACHRLGRLVSQGTWLIEALVGYAVENIASAATVAFLDAAKPNSKRIDAIVADLKAMPAPARVADMVGAGERMMFLDCAQTLNRDGMAFLGMLEGSASGADSLLRWAGRIDYVVVMRAGNRWFDRMADSMRREPREERRKAFAAMEKEFKAMKVDAQHWTTHVRFVLGGPEARGRQIGNILLALLTPALAKVQDAEDRLAQTRANLLVALALERRHREKGKYPESLADLGKVPTDVFSGKGLVYKPEGKGYLLYSVGLNGKDDGGRAPGDMPPGDDLVVRMPPKKER